MSEAAAFDFEELAASAPDANQLKSIEVVVNHCMKLMETVESTEQYLKKVKAELHDLLSAKLPDIMASAGTSEFTTDAGLQVKVKDFLAGSLPKDAEKRATALAWLSDNGAVDLIKNHLDADFDRKQDNLVGEVTELLEKLGIEYQRSRDVHHASLKSFANERLKNGEDTPLEVLGLYAGRMAEIKRKEEKAKRGKST